MPEWFNGAVLKIVEGFVLRGFKSYSLRQNWGVVKWLRHRSLTPTFRGSNPLTPAKFINNTDRWSLRLHVGFVCWGRLSLHTPA